MPAPPQTDKAILSSWVVVLLLVLVGAGLSFQYAVVVSLPHTQERMRMHDEVVAGTIASPYCYRVLVPFAVEGVRFAFAPLIGSEPALTAAYLAFELVALLSLVALAYAYLRAVFDPIPSLLGVFWLAAALPVALRSHYFQPWSLAEPVCFFLGYLALARGWRQLYAPLVVIATLNRETALFLALVGFCDWVNPVALVRRRIPLAARSLAHGALPLLLWAATYGGLRVWRGHHDHLYTVGQIFQGNLEPYRLTQSAVNVTLFAGSWILLAIVGWRTAPPFLRRVLPAAVLHAGALAVFSWWNEVRLLIPLLPVAMVPAVGALVSSKRGSKARQGPTDAGTNGVD